MEAVLEYMIPLTGLFKKQRNPKVVAQYESLPEFGEIAEDFGKAVSFFDDTVRIGEKYIFRKEKITVFALSDVTKAYYREQGGDDRIPFIHLVFRDGSDEKLGQVYYPDYPDPKSAAAEVFALLAKSGIETSYFD